MDEYGLIQEYVIYFSHYEIDFNTLDRRKDAESDHLKKHDWFLSGRMSGCILMKGKGKKNRKQKDITLNY
jgi:hypothetical protein